MKERLQKIISASGLMSRRAAEELIAAGKVSVNGVTAALGDKAEAGIDRILVDGKALPSAGEKLYIMLNKPRGYVTTLSDEKGRKNVSELVKELGTRLYPVGRLDMYSEGLLLMTNDGDFANRLMHPSHQVDKCYHTWVKGEDMGWAVELLRCPMEIDGYVTSPAQVDILELKGEEALLGITIHEGRNRQVRKMCEAAGLKVTRLMRVSEGGVKLGTLKSGRWRRLTEEELNMLLE
ncbi:MAG: pseudouridine synthase [Candidatus Limivicinus sp.]|nr:rRNA pseudouridine synthase [Clostridiales bacterium]MDY6133054.1 pseudouridine synthase [Candidatus Limivicinus sp.]